MSAAAVGLEVVMSLVNLGGVPRVILGVVHGRPEDLGLCLGMRLHLRLGLGLGWRLRRLRGELGDGRQHGLGGEAGELGLREVWAKVKGIISCVAPTNVTGSIARDNEVRGEQPINGPMPTLWRTGGGGKWAAVMARYMAEEERSAGEGE